MRIFIDGFPLLRPTDGIGRYTKEVYSRLKNVTVLTYSDMLDDEIKDIVKIPLPRRFYYAVYKLMWRMPVDFILSDKPDVIIYPNFVAVPRIKGAKSILVVHDLAYIHTPEYVSKKNLKFLEKFVPLSINEADVVIAVSETTKRDIVEQFQINKDRILVAPNAVDTTKFTELDSSELSRVKNKYGIKDDYFLFVGTIEPRKNISGILEAYEKLDQNAPALVLAGGDGWNNEKIKQDISRLRGKGLNIIITGYVDDSDLPALYSGAVALVFPSHFEGFGIPILEAQAAGIPVITSDRNPMKEVSGDGAIFVDPDNPDDIADAMVSVYADGELAKELVAKGKKNISRYSWDKTAKVFEEAIERLSK